MGETLRMFTCVEQFNSEKNAAKKPAMAEEIYKRFIDPDSDSLDTVTLTADLIGVIKARLGAKELEGVFQEASAEILVLMSANALPAFLDSLHIPSMEECFAQEKYYMRLHKYTRHEAPDLEHLVELIHEVVRYEKLPAEERLEAAKALYAARVEKAFEPALATPLACLDGLRSGMGERREGYIGANYSVCVSG